VLLLSSLIVPFAIRDAIVVVIVVVVVVIGGFVF